MSNVVPFENTNLPAAFKELNDLGSNDDLAGGMGSGFSVLSIKGSRWRLKAGGESEPIVDMDTGEIKPSIEVVLLKANPHYSKIYYGKQYEEGDDAGPDCFSIDGETPDPSGAAIQADTCASCPNDVWGSKITDSGEKGKKCSDHRRVAVLFTEELGMDPEDMVVGSALLRIPAASLKDLKLYGKGLTDAYGLPYMAVVTRLGFDHEVSYPKITFKAVRPLTDEESHTVVAMMGSEVTNSILTGSDIIATTTAPARAAPVARQIPQKSVDVSFDEPTSEETVAPAPKKTPSKKEAASPAAEPDAEPASDAEVPVSAQADIDDIFDDLDSLEL